MAAQLNNLSQDLVWEIVRKNNSYLAKNSKNGGVELSRDPLNLTNKHARRYAGFVDDKAVGVLPSEKGGVTLITKKTSAYNKPNQSQTKTTFSGAKSSRKIYKAVANRTADYRDDLRTAAVQRASAIRRSQRPVKELPAPVPRGKKAKQQAAKAAAEEA